MDKQKLLKIIGIILGVAIIFIGGIYVGKKTTPIKTVTITKYEKGETIHDSIDKPVPVYIKQTIDTGKFIAQCVKDGVFYELFPEKIKYDTLVLDKTDSTKIIADYSAKREYNETLFDSDTLGTMKIKTSVQYNRLGTINYSFTPVTKTVETTKYVERHILPFVGAGLSTFPSYGAEAGMFINKSWGFSVNGNYYPNYQNIQNLPKFDVSVKVLKMF